MQSNISITDAEFKIISLLWDHSPMTMPQITAALHEQTQWTRHTVITLLKRLAAKGAIRMQDATPARLYYAVTKKQDVAYEQTRSFLGRMFGGKATLLVNALVQQGDLTADDVNELLDLLAQTKKPEG